MHANDTLEDAKKKREKELANKRFEREEMGELLRLFSALGITVTIGIVCFFLFGLWAERRLREMGWETHKIPLIAGLVLGLVVNGYWAYMRIVRHLRRFEAPRDEPDETPDDR